MRFLLLSVATNDVSLKSSSSRQSSTSRKSSGSHSGGGSVLLDGHADGQFDILVSSRELGTQGDSTEVTTHTELWHLGKTLHGVTHNHITHSHFSGRRDTS